MHVRLGLFPLLAALSLAGPAHAAPPWEEAIAAAIGRPGTEMPGGVYRVGLPRSDLHVTLGGVALRPALALGSWVAFRRTGRGNDVMAMGDLVLTDEEVPAVMTRLLDGGIEVTALHNHLLGGSPHTMYMHIAGHGDGASLAAALHAALALSGTPLAAAPPAPAPAAPLDLDTAAIDRALGHQGRANGGVYAVSIPRAQPPRQGRMAIPDAMGAAIAINFQPTGGGRAAVTGDFVLIGSEVDPVMRELRSHGIDVTALHSHMIGEQPTIYFLHVWGVAPAVQLATGLRAALDRTNSSR